MNQCHFFAAGIHLSLVVAFIRSLSFWLLDLALFKYLLNNEQETEEEIKISSSVKQKKKHFV